MHKQGKLSSSPSSSSLRSCPKSPRSLMRLNLIFLVSYLVVSSLAYSASIIVQESDKSGLVTNSIQMQQQQPNNPQQPTQLDIKSQQQQQQQQNPETVLNVDEIITSTIQRAKKSAARINEQQQQVQTSSINNNNNNEQANKPMDNMKAEKLLKGLSSFMNPSLNPAAYFVPNLPSQSTLKSQHQKEGSSRKSMIQKTDSGSGSSSNSSDNSSSLGGQQQMSAEPSALVNIQATGEGIVSAPTRMARPQNYIFRWGR